MRYPTMSQVQSASDLEIRRWHARLPIPIGEEQGTVLDTICKRHNSLPAQTAEEANLLKNGVRTCLNS